MDNKRGVYRSTYVVLLDSPEYRELSPDSRLLLLTLKFTSMGNVAGIFNYFKDAIREQSGLCPGSFEGASEGLRRGNWVLIDGPVIWVRNQLRFDPNFSLNDPKKITNIQSILMGLPRVPLIRKFCDYYKIPVPDETLPGYEGEQLRLANGSPLEGASKGPRSPIRSGTGTGSGSGSGERAGAGSQAASPQSTRAQIPDDLSDRQDFDAYWPQVSRNGKAYGKSKAEAAELWPDFIRWYDGYPKKSGKVKAWAAWIKLTPPTDQACREVERQKREVWIEDDTGWAPQVPLPATWINGMRWQDQPEKPKAKRLPKHMRGFEEILREEFGGSEDIEI